MCWAPTNRRYVRHLWFHCDAPVTRDPIHANHETANYCQLNANDPFTGIERHLWDSHDQVLATLEYPLGGTIAVVSNHQQGNGRAENHKPHVNALNAHAERPRRANASRRSAPA